MRTTEVYWRTHSLRRWLTWSEGGKPPGILIPDKLGELPQRRCTDNSTRTAGMVIIIIIIIIITTGIIRLHHSTG